ncbi:DinB family protein [Solimonas marina]|uniref:Damage-inducible protein DinB n=1 Tax=Solimonas marina TaxID=2714601 RepID=A0A970B9G9_9GAMM|nr:DinB family protein [Solimonas marina]NKF23334.1 damage-inducible protein DinB [Solimonas marina]
MDLQTPLQYKIWADRRTLDAVARLDQRSASAAFAFARQQLNHMVRVEELFRARLIGAADPYASTNTHDVPQLTALDHRLMASNRWLQDYVRTLPPGEIGKYIRFAFVDGRNGMLTREEVIYHLINHGTYHRGAIGHALDLAGAHRPADTYTVFVHAAEPARRDAGPATDHRSSD